jgi:hypothetical protein
MVVRIFLDISDKNTSFANSHVMTCFFLLLVTQCTLQMLESGVVCSQGVPKIFLRLFSAGHFLHSSSFSCSISIINTLFNLGVHFCSLDLLESYISIHFCIQKWNFL